MISRLAGTLLERDLTEVVVDVHGVGFALAVPMSTFDKLPAAGSPAVFFTHLHVREDGMQLFGFATDTERRLFRLLITVSGVGPRLALSILSSMPVRTFCQAVAAADVKALASVNGIGKRSAERLVVELRERVGDIDPGAAFGTPEPDADAARQIQDAVAALATLGFKAEPARKAVQAVCRELSAEQKTAENLIRKALSQLNS